MFTGVNFLTHETGPENPGSVESYVDEICEFKHGSWHLFRLKFEPM